MDSMRDFIEQEQIVREYDQMARRHKRFLRKRAVAYVVQRLYGRYTAWQKRYETPGVSFIWWLIELKQLSHTWERDRDGVSEKTRQRRAESLMKRFLSDIYALVSEHEEGRTQWLLDGLQELINRRYSYGKTEVRITTIINNNGSVVDLYFAEFTVEPEDEDTAEDRLDEALEDARDDARDEADDFTLDPR